MKTNRKQVIHLVIVIVCILTIWIVRYFPAAGEFYARHIYPGIAAVLSAFSNLFPFSVGDLFIALGSVFLAGYFIYALCRRKNRRKNLFRLLLCTGWVYIWFYFAWGLNYFRQDFYTRNHIEYKAYDPDDFKSFLAGYITALNDSYVPAASPDTLPLAEELRKNYTIIADTFGLNIPGKNLKPKPMLFSRLMSKVGVTGAMGPFFTEFNLNREIRPEEYPAVYAHEMAHRLGISSEAEANLYAYLTCTASDIPAIRYSGYFLLFGYVMNNASYLLPEEEFDAFFGQIRPEIIRQYKDYRQYWRNKYSPSIGKIQNQAYNFFLKSNRIASGTKNYSEVIGLLMSYRSHNPANESASLSNPAANEGISGNKQSAPAS